MYEILLKDRGDGVWRDEFIVQSRKFIIIAKEKKGVWEAELIQIVGRSSLLHSVLHEITNASSLEDICLQFQCNMNPLYDIDFGEDGFFVTYEESPNTLALNISSKLEECAKTFSDISKSLSTSKVHVPKEVDIAFNF